MISDDEARKLAEEIVLYATTKPESNDYTEEEFTLSQAVLSLSAELTELRQAKESLDWLLLQMARYKYITPENLVALDIRMKSKDAPPYLKSRLEQKP